MVQEEKKEESWLQKLCRGDAKLYDILAGSLPLDPMAAISKDDLGTLIAQAEKSVKDENYEEAVWKYRPIVDKAIFEATLHQDEKDRYVKVIQDLLSKTARATERAKEKAEKEGRTDHVAALVKRIEYCKFVSERIEDVLEVASDFYNERLQILGEKEKGEERREKKKDTKSEKITDLRQSSDLVYGAGRVPLSLMKTIVSRPDRLGFEINIVVASDLMV